MCNRDIKQSKVIDSRPYGHLIRRRRECLKCGERWPTIEITMEEYKRIVDMRTEIYKILKKFKGFLDTEGV